MDYKPGDVVNGHLLGADGVWHPVGVARPAATRLDPTLYGARYLRRWKWTVLTLTVIAMVPMVFGVLFAGDTASAMTGGMIVGPFWLMGSLCGAVFFGSLVNLIVAAFPSQVA